MRGDGLYKIPNSRFWYYKRKENGRWRGISTKTSNYGIAKRIRSKALHEQEECRMPQEEMSRWPFERAASQYLQAAEVRVRPSSVRKERCFLVRPTKLFGRVACEQIGPTHIHELQATMK